MSATTYAWEFANHVQFIVLAAFFFGNLYPSCKYTRKNLPNFSPQKQHIRQNKVGPS